MRFETLLLALFVFGDLSSVARADLVGRQADPPTFTAADTQTIGRNEVLRDIVEYDPWLVRRILDLMQLTHGGSTAAPSVDPAKNPDLTDASRTAEGSVEWFELLKRARAEKEQREKELGVGSVRSAEGSVELIEMMKRAKAAKDALEK